MSSAPCCPTAYVKPPALGGPRQLIVAGVVKTATCFQGATPHDCPIPGYVQVTTPPDGGAVVIAYLDANGAPLPGTPVSVDCPDKVVVCESAAPSAPVTLDGQDCSGAVLPATGTAGQLTQIVQPPGQVLTVRMCPTTDRDREMVTMCAPDGTKVLIQNVTPIDAPLGTPPVIEAWTLAGAPYAGPLAALTDCGTEKVDISGAEFFCDGTNSYGRVSVWDITTATPTLLATIWQDATGAVVPQPAGPLTPGACAPSTKQLTYIERNGSIVKMADIVATTGSSIIQSVTVVQIQGTGNLAADAGSGAPIYAGQTVSWSAFSESTQDTLAFSNLVFDAGGGEQFITAVYLA